MATPKKRGPGRPKGWRTEKPRSEGVHVRLSVEDVQKLDEVRAKTGELRSAFVRRILLEKLNQSE